MMAAAVDRDVDRVSKWSHVAALSVVVFGVFPYRTRSTGTQLRPESPCESLVAMDVTW